MKIKSKVISIMCMSILSCALFVGCSKEKSPIVTAVENTEVPVISLNDDTSEIQTETGSVPADTQSESDSNEAQKTSDKEQGEASDFSTQVDVSQGLADVIPIDIVVINRCGATIGMLSIIDPINDEQINLSKIEDGNALTASVNWPRDINSIKWAIYNTDGELCIDAESDITGITKSAVIEITGDNDADDVTVKVE